jgi:hypothetical protein
MKGNDMKFKKTILSDKKILVETPDGFKMTFPNEKMASDYIRKYKKHNL